MSYKEAIRRARMTYHWMNLDEDGNELEEDDLLSHLDDQEILSLADFYDDGRITKLCFAFVELRRRLTL